MNARQLLPIATRREAWLEASAYILKKYLKARSVHASSLARYMYCLNQFGMKHTSTQGAARWLQRTTDELERMVRLMIVYNVGKFKTK